MWTCDRIRVIWWSPPRPCRWPPALRFATIGTLAGGVNIQEATRGAQPPRLELARELRDNVPAARSGSPNEGSSERILGAWHLEIAWPKRDQLTRTYVNSCRVIRTRVDANRREFSAFRGFESRPFGAALRIL